MCKGPSDMPAKVVQQALGDNLYLPYLGLTQWKPADYQRKPAPHPKPSDTPGPPGFHVPDLDI